MPRDKVEQHGHDDLAGEHTLGDRGQAIFALVFIVVWLLDSFLLKWTVFLNAQVSLWIRLPLAALCFGLATYWVRAGLAIVFGEERVAGRVIREGVFGRLRHPIYVGELLIYLGVLMLSLSLAAAVVGLGAALFLFYLSRYEEKLLIARYGDAYRQYMRDVPMWLPRL